jgi:hypothetical protein
VQRFRLLIGVQRNCVAQLIFRLPMILAASKRRKGDHRLESCFLAQSNSTRLGNARHTIRDLEEDRSACSARPRVSTRPIPISSVAWCGARNGSWHTNRAIWRLWLAVKEALDDAMAASVNSSCAPRGAAQAERPSATLKRPAGAA